MNNIQLAIKIPCCSNEKKLSTSFQSEIKANKELCLKFLSKKTNR